MEKKSLQSHFEKMDHEFPRVDFSLEKFGYKLDGHMGVKVCCGLSFLKSADYIEEKKGKIAFIEFSDIRRQYHDLIGKFKIIRAIKVDDKGERIALKDAANALMEGLAEEMKIKFKDTVHLVGKVDEFYHDKPESFNSRPYAILVIAPDSDEDQPCRKDEVGRRLDRLKNQLVRCFPSSMFQEVLVYEVDHYASK